VESLSNGQAYSGWGSHRPPFKSRALCHARKVWLYPAALYPDLLPTRHTRSTRCTAPPAATRKSRPETAQPNYPSAPVWSRISKESDHLFCGQFQVCPWITITSSMLRKRVWVSLFRCDILPRGFKFERKKESAIPLFLRGRTLNASKIVADHNTGRGHVLGPEGASGKSRQLTRRKNGGGHRESTLSFGPRARLGCFRDQCGHLSG